MEIVFLAKMGSIRQEWPSYPVICMHWGGKTGSQFPGLGCGLVLSIGAAGVSLHRLFCIRREVQLLQAFLTGHSYLALRLYPVPPLGIVD